ncbi:MAG: sugar phosphate isomerase/epimerase family protein [Fimbriimonadaceae bacterium]
MQPDRIAAQFYTLRELTATAEGFREALRRVSEIGYSAVQLSAVAALENGVSAAQARAWLDEYGLRCIATHRPWKRLTSELNAEIDFHHVLGCDYVAIGGTVWDYGYEPADYRRFMEDAKPVIAALKAGGIRFGVHNHAAEFMKFDGVHPFELWLNEGGADLMLEVDTYWVVDAGVDIVSLLRRCAGRIPVIHVKDREVAREGTRMAPIGEGNLDWQAIVAVGDAGGVESYVVEQDVCARDPFDCLRASFDYLMDLDVG